MDNNVQQELSFSDLESKIFMIEGIKIFFRTNKNLNSGSTYDYRRAATGTLSVYELFHQRIKLNVEWFVINNQGEVVDNRTRLNTLRD